MVRLSQVLAAVSAIVMTFASLPSQAAGKDICEMDKAMLGFQPEPSRIAFSATRTSIEVYHTYQSPSTMKKFERLTCKLHLDCTINSRAGSFSLHVEELDHGVGSIVRKQRIVRAASAVDFKNSSGASVQKCKIKKITD